MIDEEGRDKNESKRRLKTVEYKKLMKRRGESNRGLECGWMGKGGRGVWREGQVLSGEERESRNERYIAPGKPKTIVTLPPITHFNLKQQIFFHSINFYTLEQGPWLKLGFYVLLQLQGLHTSLCLPSSLVSLYLLYFPSEKINILPWKGSEHALWK